MKIKKVCAWCSRPMGTIECNNQNSSPSQTSHGMCEECLEMVMAELEEAVEEYIANKGENNPKKEEGHEKQS